MIKKNYEGGSLANTVISWHKGFETKDIEGGGIETTNYFFANRELVAMKKPGNIMRYFHSDHLGSTTVITDQSGDLVEETSFGPWGELLEGGTESKYQFTGQEKDTETGLNYMNARYYSSDLKRFTQPDTLLPDVYDPQLLNRYAYARNNPLKYTDPSGHDIVIQGGRIQSTNSVLNNPSPKPAQTTQQYVNSITNPLGNRSTSIANPSNNASRSTSTPNNSSSDCRCSKPSGGDSGGNRGTGLIDELILNDFRVAFDPKAGVAESTLATASVLSNLYPPARGGVWASKIPKVFSHQFKNDALALKKFGDHGAGLGYKTPEEYVGGANKLFLGGDYIEEAYRSSDRARGYFNHSTGEFGVLNQNGTIRNYFRPDNPTQYWYNGSGF